MSPRSMTSLLAAGLSVGLALPASAGPGVPTSALQGSFGSPRPARIAVDPRFSISRSDGNDVKGSLDLRSMKISRGKSSDTIVFATYDAVSNAAIDSDNGNFAVLIDTNDDRRFNFAQYVFFAAGKIRGLLFNLKTNHVVDRTAPTSRANAKTFRTVIQRGKIDSPGTYRFAVFGYYLAKPCSKKKPCIDSIPNRLPLIPLDHKAPSVSITDFDRFSGDDVTLGNELKSPISFTFHDDTFGTGVKLWTVQKKEVGGGTGWVTAKKGKITVPTVQVDGEEGLTYDLRVVVVDKQKNKKISSTRRTTFPLDEGSLTYSIGTPTPFGQVGAFLDNVVSIGNTEFATYTFDSGSQVCVMGGPSAASATATLEVDSLGVVPMAEETTTLARTKVGCQLVSGMGPHTLKITGTSAVSFVIDGFYIVP